MADVYREELVLDTRSALAAINRLEAAARDVLSNLRIDIDPQAARSVASALQDVAQASTRLESNLEGAEEDLRASSRAAATLAGDLGRTESSARGAAREAATIDDRLAAAERSASRLLLETLDVESAAGRAEVDFREVAQALGIGEDAARRMGREVIDAQVAANKLEDATQKVARQMGLSEDEARKFENSMQRAARAANDVDTSGGRLSGTLGRLRTGFAAIGAVVATIGFAGVVRGLNAAVEASSALAESTSKAEVVFGRQLASVQNALGDTAQTVLLSEQAALEAVATFGNLFTALGLTQQQAASLSPGIVQLAADLASFNNARVEDVLVSLRAGLVGEVEPLRRLGVAINAATVEQRALRDGLVDANGEVTEAGKVQARYALILEQTRNAQGDVARTLDGYANTSRAARAEVGNFAAELGDVLVPAFQAALALVPAIIAGLRQLIPTFGAAAGSAAEFFRSTGEATGGSFARDVAIAVGTFGEIGGAITNAAQIANAGKAALMGDFSQIGKAFDDVAARGAASAARVAQINIAQELELGGDALTAFANGIAHVARESESVEGFGDAFRRLALAAGLSTGELRTTTAFLLDNAEAAGLSAEEIAFLREQYIALTAAVDAQTRASEGERFRQTNEDVIGLRSGLRGLNEELTGLDLGNAIASSFEIDDNLLRDRLDAQIPGVTAAAAAIKKAAGDLGDSLDPFREATAALPVSANKFLQNLRTQATKIAQFDAGVVRLRVLGFDELADELAAQGPAAQQALTEFLGDLNKAAEAEGLLEGQGTEAARKYGAELAAMLSDPSISAETRAALVTLIEEGGIDSPQVAAAIEAGAANAARITATAYGDATVGELEGQLEGDLGDLIEEAFSQPEAAGVGAGVTSTAYARGVINRLTAKEFGLKGDIGDAIAAGFAADDATNSKIRAAGERAADTYFDGVRSGAQITSPSRRAQEIARLIAEGFTTGSAGSGGSFRSAGKLAADGFFAGWTEALGTLPVPQVAAVPSGDLPVAVGVAATVGGSVTVEQHFEGENIPKDAAKGAQIAGSIISMLGLVRGPGTGTRV